LLIKAKLAKEKNQHLTQDNYCAAFRRLGFRKTAVGAMRLFAILLHHIFATLVLLRKPLYGLQKRQLS
jgi:hypothetical protein